MNPVLVEMGTRFTIPMCGFVPTAAEEDVFQYYNDRDTPKRWQDIPAESSATKVQRKRFDIWTYASEVESGSIRPGQDIKI